MEKVKENIFTESENRILQISLQSSSPHSNSIIMSESINVGSGSNNSLVKFMLSEGESEGKIGENINVRAVSHEIPEIPEIPENIEIPEIPEVAEEPPSSNISGSYEVIAPPILLPNNISKKKLSIIGECKEEGYSEREEDKYDDMYPKNDIYENDKN